VIEVLDGHHFPSLLKAFDLATENAEKETGKPIVLVAHTKKGKGVKFMENNVDFHGKATNKEQYRMADEGFNEHELELNRKYGIDE